MQSHADKSQSSPDIVTQKKSAEAAFTFSDQRPETAQLKQLQTSIVNSSRMQEAAQLQAITQRKANKTGLPDQLKSGVENLSGHSLDDVKVHYNSDKPAKLQAHAYAQGTDIHVAPGQEKHLPHEAWHVVQQKQGRVKPTTQLKKGVAVNDDSRLETEADVMGAKAVQLKKAVTGQLLQAPPLANDVAQLYVNNGDEYEFGATFDTNHLSGSSGTTLKNLALSRSRARGGSNNTLINEAALRAADYDIRAGIHPYDFRLSIDLASGKAYSAQTRTSETAESITSIVVAGYTNETDDGNEYLISHLSAAQ